MIFNIKPVSHIFSFAVYWKRFVMTNIIDEQGYQLLRKLIGSVVVGTVGDHHRQTIGVMISPYKMIRGGFRRSIGTVRIIGCHFSEKTIIEPKSAIHLIGGDMIKAFICVALFPLLFCCLQ